VARPCVARCSGSARPSSAPHVSAESRYGMGRVIDQHSCQSRDADEVCNERG
jgi:hypothetical protein